MATLRSMGDVALQDLGILGAGQTMTAAQGQMFLVRTNRMLQAWTLQPLTVPYIKREVFDATVGKGSPTNPYTIGPGGDFDTVRPPQILGFAELQNSGTTNEVEIPRGLLTPDAWEAIQVKRITNALGTNLYYQPTYAGGLGAIYIWPVQSTTDYKVVLYTPATLSEFADLDTDYDLPPGAEAAIQYNAAELMIPSFQVPDVSASRIVRLAAKFLGAFKRGNTKMADLPTDPALTSNNRYGYNIQTGTGG